MRDLKGKPMPGSPEYSGYLLLAMALLAMAYCLLLFIAYTRDFIRELFKKKKVEPEIIEEIPPFEQKLGVPYGKPVAQKPKLQMTKAEMDEEERKRAIKQLSAMTSFMGGAAGAATGSIAPIISFHGGSAPTTIGNIGFEMFIHTKERDPRIEPHLHDKLFLNQGLGGSFYHVVAIENYGTEPNKWLISIVRTDTARAPSPADSNAAFPDVYDKKTILLEEYRNWMENAIIIERSYLK